MATFLLKIVRSLYFYLFIFCFILVILFFLSTQKNNFSKNQNNEDEQIRVLTYSTFLKNWGPGPDIAKEFHARTGKSVKWIEVNNAGMILENLSRRSENEMPDVVIGLDLLSLDDAQKTTGWSDSSKIKVQFVRDLPTDITRSVFKPYNWAPMTFIFKRSELPIPSLVDDLLSAPYANSLALQDPRTSSTGMYFLMWVLALKGEQEGFEFLKKLKSSVRIVSPSWSAAYSLFQNNQVPMVFSFFTSPIYHYVNENDYRYQPVYFDNAHIYSVEFAGVPKACKNCELAHQFVEFLLSPYAQKKIMEKNYMLPVVEKIKDNTPFDFPKTVRLIEPDTYQALIKNKEQILKTWEDLNL